MDQFAFPTSLAAIVNIYFIDNVSDWDEMKFQSSFDLKILECFKKKQLVNRIYSFESCVFKSVAHFY